MINEVLEILTRIEHDLREAEDVIVETIKDAVWDAEERHGLMFDPEHVCPGLDNARGIVVESVRQISGAIADVEEDYDTE